MTMLEQLARSNAPVIVALLTAQLRHPDTVDNAWNNQPTWDNWNQSTPAPWSNQPTWDNWSKSK